MTNKSGDIGRKTEKAVVDCLKIQGFPHAERRRPHGPDDTGDIVTGDPRVVVQVKGGKAAEQASDLMVFHWLSATAWQVVHAGAEVGILVLKRRAVGYPESARWWAVVWSDEFTRLATCGACTWTWEPRTPVRLHLADACALLCRVGYGEAP